MRYFERVLEKMSFKFIPLFSTKDNSILGYKVMKDFSTLGFDDKEYMYQMAFEEKLFDNFALKVFEKACNEIIERKIENTFIFYTLRFNFLNDPSNFFYQLDRLIAKLNLKSDFFIFDIKGIEDWREFYKEHSKSFKYKLILKEEKNSPFNLAILEDSKATYMEPRTIDTLAFIKGNMNFSQPLIFNLAYVEGLDLDFLKNLDVDYYYDSK